MSETVITPMAGPAWQRVALGLLAVCGLLMLFVLVAGQFLPLLFVFVAAVVVAASAPGNRRTKQVVIPALAVMVILSAASPIWV